MANNVPLSTDVPKIYVPSLSAKQIYVPHIKAPHLAAPFKSTAIPRTAERRHVKDLGDIILGNPITGTRQLQHTLEDYDQDWVKYVPLLNRIVGVGLMAKERVLQPLYEGEPGKVIINTLESLGSSLDILANPIKSLMPWANGGDLDDLYKSMGWLDNSYRETYQWDTGNFLVDFVGEIVSDPTNWLTLGGSSLLKVTGATNKVLDMADKAINKSFNNEFASLLPDSVKLDVISKAADDIVDDNGRIIKSLRDHLIDKKRRALIQMNKFSKGSPRYNAAKQLYDAYDSMAKFDKFDALEVALADLRMSKEFKWYNTIRKAIDIGNRIDRAVMTATEVVLPQIGLTHVFIKYGVVPGYKMLHNKVVMDLNNYDLEQITKHPTQAVKYLKQNVGLHDDIANKAKYIKAAQLLAEADMNADDLHKLWIEVYQSTPVILRTDYKRLRTKYVDKLIKEIPALRTFGKALHHPTGSYVLPKEALEVLQRYKLTVKDIAELIDAIMARGAATVEIDILIPKVYKKLIDDRYNLFLKTHKEKFKDTHTILKEALNKYKIEPGKNAPIPVDQLNTYLTGLELQLHKDFDLLYHIKYIHKEFLKVDNKHYGLANLQRYFSVVRKQDPRQAELAKEFLDYFGISISNSKYIYTKLIDLDNTLNNAKQLLSTGQHTKYNKVLKTLHDDYMHLINTLRANQQGVFVTMESLERAAKEGPNLFKAADGELYLDMNKNPQRAWLDKYIKDPANNVMKKGYLRNITESDKRAYYKDRDALLAAFGIDKGTSESYAELIKQYHDTVTNPNAHFGTSLDASDLDVLQREYGVTYGFEEDEYSISHFILDNASTEVRTWLESIYGSDINELLERFESQILGSGGGDPFFFLQEYNKANVESLSYWDFYLGELSLTDIKESIRSISQIPTGTPVPKSIRNYINNINDVYTQLPNYKEAFKDLQDMRKFIQSKYSMFVTQMSYIHRLDNFAEYYNQLSLPDSVLRTNLEAAIVHLMDSRDEAAMRAALFIRELLAKVDASNVLENSLGYIKLPNTLKLLSQGNALEDAVQNALRELFYSTIYEFRNMRTVLASENVNTMWSKFMYNYYYNIKPMIQEIISKGDANYLPENETLDTVISFIDKQISSMARESFDYYNSAMLQIAHYTGVDLPYMYTLDNRAVNIAKQLRMDYPDIISVVAGKPAYKRSVHDMIQQFAGGVTKQTVDEMEQVYKAKADLVKGDEAFSAFDIDLNLDYKYIDSFETAMYSAYNEIYRTNRQLANFTDTPSKIGRTSFNKGVAKRVYEDTIYMTADQVNRYAYQNIFVDNAYALSLATSLTAKKVNPKNIVEGALDLKYFNPKISDREYKLLFETYQNSKIKIKAYKNLNERIAEAYRKALTEFFIHFTETVHWGPADPMLYFAKADIEELYIWNDVVRNRSLNSNNITYANMYKQAKLEVFEDDFSTIVSNTLNPDELHYTLDYASNPKLFIDDIKNKSEDFTQLHDDNVWGPMTINTTKFQLDQLFDRVEESLYKTIKDPATLQRRQQALIEHQKHSVGIINNLRALTDLEKDNRLIKDVITDPKELAILRGFRLHPEHLMKGKETLNYITDETHQMFKNNFLNFTPKQVRKYLEDYTFEGKALYIDTERNLAPFTNKAALKEAGVGIVSDPSEPGVFMLYTLAGDYETEDIVWNVYKSIFPNIKKKVVKAIADSQQAYAWGSIDIPYELFDGLVIYRKQYDTIMKSELFSKLSQKALHFSPVLGFNNSIKNSIGLPNFTIIGGSKAYMKALDLSKQAFKDAKIYPMYYSKAITRRVTHGLLNAVHTQDQKMKYLSLFLNDDYYLDNPLFRRVFANADDKQIEDIFSRNNFVAAVVKEDKKGNPKVYKINITNRKQLEDAINAKAVILPHEVYRNMVLTVNDYKFDNKFMQVYERTIMFAYKTIYLSHVGTLMRNILDSKLFKPALSTDGLGSLAEHFKYQHQATRLLDWYNKIHQEVFDITHGSTFNRRVLASVLSKRSPEEKYWYAIVDTFINSSASGGNSEAMMAFWTEYNLKRAGYSGFAWEKYLADVVSESPRVNAVQVINNHIEQSARLGMLLYELDHGYNIPTAIRNIISTHFDYALKDDMGYLLERLFWFSTFSINNLMYYVNIGLTKNPNVLDAYLDALELSWNDGEDYTWEEVKDSPYLTYWATLGHLRFKWNDDKDIIFKTGSSFLDFFSIIFGPNQEFQDRLNPFLSVLLGYENPSNLNPWAADISYGKQFLQGRSLVPSVYTTINRYKDYKRKHRIEKRPYISSTSSWRTYPKRLPNRRTKPIRSRFAYTRNWRQYTRYFHRNSNPPQWVYRNSRQHHIPNRYIRNQKIRI